MKAARARTLPATASIGGVWFRAIQTKYSATPLAYIHSRTIPGRFNPGTVLPPSFPVLYLAQTRRVAEFEVGALLGSPLPGGTWLPNLLHHWSILDVAVMLHRVADLTALPSLHHIDTTIQELTGDWRGYGLRAAVPTRPAPIPTQALGAALHRRPTVEAILTFSAKVPTERVLIVFPKNVLAMSSVTHTDASGTVHRVP